jgi:hypothetical protein
MRSTALVALAALVGGTLSAPATAHAQFGKLGKKMAEKAAVSKASNAAGVSSSGGSDKVQVGKVSFNDRVLEITAPRVEQFIKGLEAEKAMIAKMEGQDRERIERENHAAEAAYNKKRDAYDKSREDYEKCAQPLQDQAEKEMQRTQDGTGVDEAAMNKIADRIKAAQAAGNMKEMQRLVDSLQRAIAAPNAQMAATANGLIPAIKKKCGEPQPEPAKPVLKPLIGPDEVRQAAEEASGFDGGQWAIMRERIAPFVQSKGEGSGGLIFTAGEVEVLKAQLPALSAYVEQMKGY